jgi:hypothetical protein
MLREGTIDENDIVQRMLREGTIDENDIVHFVETCYCLEGGLYPMAMEIPTLKEYFDNIVEVKTPVYETNVPWSVSFVIALEV